MHKELALLREMPLFSAVPDDQLHAFAKVSKTRRVPRGTAIVRAGDATDSLYILLSGRARVIASDSEGREIILSILGPGDFFGEMGMIDDSPRSADVVAAEASEVLAISKADFLHCLQNSIELAFNIMKCLVVRLREADRKIEALALMDVHGRVAKLLLDISEFRAGRRIIPDGISKQEIAKMIGASREMVSRVIRDLEARGHIQHDNDGVIVLHNN